MVNNAIYWLLLTNCNIPPSFYQLYTFRAFKSVLLALPRLKVLLMYSLWREIQGISTKFWHYFPKFDFVLLKEPFATLKKSKSVVHAWCCCHFLSNMANFTTFLIFMVSKSDLAKVEHDQLCSSLVVVANKFVYVF